MFFDNHCIFSAFIISLRSDYYFLLNFLGGFTMKFEDSGLNGKVIEFSLLEHVMDNHGMIRAGQWDYDRITYDYKFEDMTNGDVYYFRFPCHVIEAETETPHAKVELGTPYLGKHYYPHGVEYDEEFPKHVVNQCNKLIEALHSELHV
jgi:YugN-like family